MSNFTCHQARPLLNTNPRDFISFRTSRAARSNWHVYVKHSARVRSISRERTGRPKPLILKGLILKSRETSVRRGKPSIMLWRQRPANSLRARTNWLANHPHSVAFSAISAERTVRSKLMKHHELMLGTRETFIRSHQHMAGAAGGEAPISIALRREHLRPKLECSLESADHKTLEVNRSMNWVPGPRWLCAHFTCRKRRAKKERSWIEYSVVKRRECSWERRLDSRFRGNDSEPNAFRAFRLTHYRP